MNQPSSLEYEQNRFHSLRSKHPSLQGHEFSPLVYHYDQGKGTIEFVEKLDRQGINTGRQSIGLVFSISTAK